MEGGGGRVKFLGRQVSCVANLLTACLPGIIFALQVQGVFFTGPPPEKFKYGKLRLGEVRCI